MVARVWIGTLLLGLGMLAGPAAYAQDVILRATVDRPTVRENESFTYVLHAQGQVRGQPDFQSLTTDFRILQSSRNTSIQMAGGRTTAVTEWVLQLMPMSPGTFTIAPIDFSGALSNPVGIEVLPALAGDAPSDIFIEVEASPARIYAQAELIYTIRLFRGVSTGRSSLSAPTVAGGEVIVERLGDDREYQVVRDGRSFMTLERRYAIYPQTAGHITIEPVTLDAVVITSSGFRGMQVFSSEALELDVLSPVAPPSQWASAAWLPARNVELTERWSADPDALTAGVPQTRTLILEAEGVQASQLPELEVEPVDGLRQYPDQPELTSEVAQTGLQARRTERYAVIAQTDGQLTVAGVAVPWFDVDDGQWKLASLPPRPLEILPNPDQVADESAAVAPLPAESRPRAAGGFWQAVSAGLLVAWLGTLGLWWQSRRPARVAVPKPDPTVPRRSANRRLLRQLRAACDANDARRAHALLLEWGSLRLPGQAPLSLGAMLERLPTPLAAAVAELERVLYGPGVEDWNGGALAAALVGIDAPGRAEADSDDVLLPLYR